MDVTIDTGSKLKNKPRWPAVIALGSTSLGWRHARRRLRMCALTTVFFAMAIVMAPPGGAHHTAAQMVSTNLLGGIAGEVRSEEEINGSPELVWAVLTDLALYPVWNPFLYPVEGELRPGSPIQVTMHTGTQIVSYRATVLQVEPNRVLSWSGQVLSSGVYDTTYSFSIEPLRGGRVRLVSRETRRGLAPVVEWLLGSAIQGGLDAMTRSTRNRVELLRPFDSSWSRPTSYSTR
jgi:hypothetical protein